MGGYRLDEQIGSGAMGTVYRAFDLKLQRDVALKIVSAEDESSELFLRFVQEGAAAARIRHPNVVQVFNAGAEGGYAYLAMQLLEGETLAEHLARRGRLPLTCAVDYVLPICAALMAAHEAGVLHRDLKPANIFLAEVGKGSPEPYLLDFGVSKLDGPVDAALTQNPRFLGTPFYIAPEQADGAAGSWLSDQYSLALCLYECLLGVRPFEEHKSSLMKLLRHVAEGGIPSARNVDMSIPLGLDSVLDRALSRAPTDRFESMRDFGAALLPFASPIQRQIWLPTFVSATDSTMASVDAPSFHPNSWEHSGEVTIDRTGGRSASSRLSESSKRTAAFAEANPLSQEVPSTTSFRPGSWDSAHFGSEGGPRTTTPPSSRRFNSMGVERPPAPESKHSPLALALLAAIGACTLAMSFWLFREEFGSSPRSTYVAEVEVKPADAEITLDGTTLSRGSLSLVLPKNGERHELLITHPEYEPSKVLFQDRPPAPSISLRRLVAEEQPVIREEPAASFSSNPKETAVSNISTPARRHDPAATSSAITPSTEDAHSGNAPTLLAATPELEPAVEEPLDGPSDVPSDSPSGAAPKPPATHPPQIHTGNLNPWAE